MTKPNDRSRRVADLIQRELAQIIIRESVNARLRLVTVTAVKITPDYAIATIQIRIR
jgi:ribosome-binding factor A